MSILCIKLWTSLVLSFFFFQAEDCIRDPLVTGVQTCALPIFGGNACVMPLSPRTPAAMSCLYVGIAPAAAYFSIRSGRMPSDENSNARPAAPTEDDACAAVAGVPYAARVPIRHRADAAATNARRCMAASPESCAIHDVDAPVKTLCPQSRSDQGPCPAKARSGGRARPAPASLVTPARSARTATETAARDPNRAGPPSARPARADRRAAVAGS